MVVVGGDNSRLTKALIPFSLLAMTLVSSKICDRVRACMF